MSKLEQLELISDVAKCHIFVSNSPDLFTEAEKQYIEEAYSKIDITNLVVNISSEQISIISNIYKEKVEPVLRG